MDRQGFIYLDIEHPVVAWNTYRGVLMSREQIGARHGAGVVSLRLAGIFDSGDFQRLQSELAIDAIRVRDFPSAVSRLSGMFVFDEVESALAAEQAAWGGHINSEYLTDVGLTYGTATRVDANWITQMLDADANLVPGWEQLAAKYWDGEACGATPIWEFLVDGSATVWGTHIRNQAYEVIQSRYPQALGLLEESRIAALLGFSLGHISSWLTRKGDHAELAFYLDNTANGDPRYRAAVEQYLRTAPPGSVNAHALLVSSGVARLPDLSSYFKVLPLSPAQL
ncbi:hypothetical protein CAL26_01425 [Bordetella genomosp. 9]|uniref:Uncharacterized protein n=1 Tax=Bordetella genomosp. 9 TaxID=1416803 RepID=A0A261RMZ6_9BORD|nr:hypothetical protein [Bordetella genomosp. 9]OZI26042.1 hypothetical protein CAL26_01425 [Bordetella genomosp. 9]